VSLHPPILDRATDVSVAGHRRARGAILRARRLAGHETAVSRDERNEYHGITVDRARKVLEALGVRLVTRVEVEPLRAAGERPASPLRTARKKPR
jgi:hypothetical protein